MVVVVGNLSAMDPCLFVGGLVCRGIANCFDYVSNSLGLKNLKKEVRVEKFHGVVME